MPVALRHHRLFALGATCAAASVAFACQLVVPLETVAPSSADAGVDAHPAPVQLSCADPAGIDPTLVGQGGDITAELAFATVATDGDGGMDLCPHAGFDLDKVSTCLGDGGEPVSPTCPPGEPRCHWGPSCSAPDHRPTCDEPGGVDNAIGAALRADTLSTIPNFDRRQIDPNVILRAGTANVLIRLSGYNGEPDDPDVSVAFFSSSGIDESTAPMLPEGYDAGPEYLRARWDGRSRRRWFVDPHSIVQAGSYAPKWTTTGFVRDGVLVLTSATAFIPVGLPITLYDARLIGELRRVGNEWHLVRGMLGGRISIVDLIHSLDPIVYFAGSLQTVCKQPGVRDLLTAHFCRFTDLSSDAGACDSLSVGITFTAVPAEIGLIREPLGGLLRGDCPDAAVACPGVP